jgi:hypothetical protein
MVFLVLLGLGCQLTLKPDLDILESLVQTLEWAPLYGNKTLATVIVLTKCYFWICSVVALIIAVLMFFILRKAVDIGEK